MIPCYSLLPPAADNLPSHHPAYRGQWTVSTGGSELVDMNQVLINYTDTHDSSVLFFFNSVYCTYVLYVDS